MSWTWIKSRQVILHQARETMKEYANLKLEQEDWHGCSDACNDIRDIDAELTTLEKLESFLKPRLQEEA